MSTEALINKGGFDMTFADINKEYAKIVASYFENGYYINAGTMSGTQGEIAHIDLTNGKEVIRVLMERNVDFRKDVESIQIIVGKCTGNIKPNWSKRYCDIWNNELEIIKTVEFFQIGRDSMCYGTLEEAETARDKRRERYKLHGEDNEVKKEMSDKAKEIALKWLRRQPRCKSTKLSDIESVQSILRHNRFSGKTVRVYSITAKGNQYTMA